MKIAVIMSTYNGGAFLEEQLNSIVKQTIVNDLTLYIRDDGSTDNTIELIESFQDRCDIRLIKGENVGPGNSFWELLMNPGIQADYYAFADQDDIWDEDKLENAIYTLGMDYNLYLCNCRVVNSLGEITKNFFRDTMPAMTVPRQCICGIGQGCAMVFTDALRKNIMNAVIRCIPLHDTLVMLYALGLGKVFYDFRPHFSYRMHDGNVVAKSGKNFIGRVCSSLKTWKSNAANSMAEVAAELLKNLDGLDSDTAEYLNDLKNYKKSFLAKRRVMKYPDVDGISPQALRSYRMRVWFNLF